MPECRIDRDEYEATRAELIDRHERQDGGAVIITGSHEDHGQVTLRREAGVFTIEAEDLSLVRPWGVAMERVDED